MKVEKYQLKSETSLTIFEFISEGHKRLIRKSIPFQQTNDSKVYNLAFGDKNPYTVEINDIVVSNNSDSEKILATVVSEVYAFFDKHPDTFVYAADSTEPFATNKIQHKLIMHPIKTKVSTKYIVITAFAVLSSWLLHEFAHYLTGEALGYRMIMSLNQGYPVDGHYNRDLHYQLISASGPLVTLIEALFVSLLMQRRRTVFLYPFLFICFYMRLFSGWHVIHQS